MGFVVGTGPPERKTGIPKEKGKLKSNKTCDSKGGFEE